MAAIGAEAYTQLVATTMEKWDSKDLVDNVFTRHPTLDLFKDKAVSKTGRQLVSNIEALDNKVTEVSDDSGTFDTSVSPEFIGSAVYDWSAPLITPIRVEWKRLQENAGKEQIVNLAKAHIENAKKSHARYLVGLMHAAAGTSPSGSYLPFDEVVSDATYDADNDLVVGGIQTWEAGTPNVPDTDHFWQSYRAEIPANEGVTGYMPIRKAFRHMRNELLVRTGNMHQVSHIIAGRKVFEEFEDSFDDKIRYVEFGDGQARFRGIYDGDIEVRLDPDCQENRAYFLDVDAWDFSYLNGNFMKTQPTQNIEGTLDFITPIASVLALGTNERRASALLERDYDTT